MYSKWCTAKAITTINLTYIRCFVCQVLRYKCLLVFKKSTRENWVKGNTHSSILECCTYTYSAFSVVSHCLHWLQCMMAVITLFSPKKLLLVFALWPHLLMLLLCYQSVPYTKTKMKPLTFHALFAWCLDIKCSISWNSNEKDRMHLIKWSAHSAIHESYTHPDFDSSLVSNW